MDKQFIIAVGREYGSGGHEIAEIIAKELGFKLYDRRILEGMAAEKDIRLEDLEKYDEKPKNIVFSRNVGGYSNSNEEVMAELEFEYLKEKAKTGESFVVVGRCGETVFKEHKGLVSLFITGDYSNKLNRIMKKYNLSEKEAASKISRHDKNRKKYHNYHSDFKWGDSRYYDMCINSSRLGEKATAGILINYIKERMGQ